MNPRCRECHTEMVLHEGQVLKCPKSPSHPTRVVITEATRDTCEALGQDWAALTDPTRNRTVRWEGNG